VRYLLELARLDLFKPDPASQAIMFEPAVRQSPENMPLAVTVGQALIRASRSEQGLEVLRAALGRHPDSPEAWDAWLAGLDEAGRPDEFSKEFARLPRTLVADTRFAKHEGLVAQNTHDWRAAVHAFERALAFEPFNAAILFRLSRSLHLAGDDAESERVDNLIKSRQKAVARLQELVDRALAVKTLGVEPQPELYERMAEARERMGRPDDAKAWHRLLLQDNPGYAPSLAALKRLP
jgi:tetratricopeptide (TPR) repeat protein